MTGGGVLADVNSKPLDPKNQKFTFEIFKVAVLSAVGGFLFGYDTGVVSGAMVFIKEVFVLDSIWQEVIISVTILGAWMFSMPAGYTADRWGRKMVIYAASLIFTVGAIMMAVAWNKYILLLGRYVVGAAIGFASMVVPMYIAEMAPAHVRGSLVTLNNLFIAGGQAFAAIVAGACSKMDKDVGWRVMLGIAAIPSIIQFIGFLFMPESPRWLIRKNQDFKAMEVLQKIRGPDADIEEEYEQMKATCKDSEDSEGRGQGCMGVLGEVLRDPHLRKALIIGCMLQTVQQLTGINTVMYYAATIIVMSGVYDKSKAVWFAAITAVINFLCNFAGVYLVERMGRRMLTLLSLAGVIFSLCILAIGFTLAAANSPNLAFEEDDAGKCRMSVTDSCNDCITQADCGYCFYDFENSTGSYGTCLLVDDEDKEQKSINGSLCGQGTMVDKQLVWAKNWCPNKYSWMTLFGLCLYLLFFGPGMGPMPWTINSEMYPLWARSVCFSTATAFNWFFNMLVSLTFLSLTEVLTKQGAFWLYAGFGTAGLIYFYLVLPETKGKSLEDTAALFAKDDGRRGSNGSTTKQEKRRTADGSKPV